MRYFVALGPGALAGALRLAALTALLSVTAAAPARGVQAPTADGPSQEVQSDHQALEPGDLIRLGFWRDPDVSGDYAVDENGEAVLPFLGVRTVVDVPASDLRRLLLDDYRGQLRNQDVQLTFLRRVRVLGAVTTPGLYHVDPTMTLADVVALAGGATNDGNLERVRIQRGGVDRLLDVDAGTVMDRLRSGDQVLVEQKSWLSRNGRFLVGGVLSVAAILASRLAW